MLHDFVGEGTPEKRGARIGASSHHMKRQVPRCVSDLSLSPLYSVLYFLRCR